MVSVAIYVQFPLLPLARVLNFNIVHSSMIFSFDTIYFCVYNNIMDQKQMRAPKSKIDNKFAAYTFLMIILFYLLGIVIVDILAAGADVDFENFWESSVRIIMIYAVLLGLFFILNKQLRQKGAEIANSINLNKKITVDNLILIFIIAGLVLASFMLFVQGFADIIIWFGVKSEGGMGANNIPQYLMAIFVLCLLPAVIEELFFRGLILKGLLPSGKMAATIGSAILFALFHLNPHQIIFQFILGVVLAVVVLKTGNLLYSMILHFLNNFMVVTTYTFLGDPLTKLAWNPLTILMALVLAAVGTVMTVGVVKAIKTHGERAEVPKTEKFFSIGNIGFFVAVLLGLCILGVVILG